MNVEYHANSLQIFNNIGLAELKLGIVHKIIDSLYPSALLTLRFYLETSPPLPLNSPLKDRYVSTVLKPY